MAPETRDHSFDELARGLASGDLTRGKALRLMGAALLGGTLASVPGIAVAAAKPRPNGRKCKTNIQCVSSNCQGGVCKAQPCQAGETNCNGTCVPDCTSGQVLDSSTCTCGCPSGTTACGTGCVTNCTSGQVLDPSTCTCGGGGGGCTADTSGCCAGGGNSFCSANASSTGTTCWTTGTCIQPGVTGNPQSCADCGASQACVSTYLCPSNLACVNPCAS
jgi:hypothetical protein